MAHHCIDAEELKATFSVTDEKMAVYRSIGRLELLAKLQERAEQWLIVCDHALSNDLIGFVLRNSESTQWCVITPDVEPGMFRYSAFDARGFYMHGTYYTPGQALIEVFRMGFRYPDSPCVLDRLCLGSQWVAYHNV